MEKVKVKKFTRVEVSHSCVKIIYIYNINEYIFHMVMWRRENWGNKQNLEQ